MGCFCDEARRAPTAPSARPFGDDPNTHDDVIEVQLFNCPPPRGLRLAFRSVVSDGDSTARGVLDAHRLQRVAEGGRGGARGPAHCGGCGGVLLRGEPHKA